MDEQLDRVEHKLEKIDEKLAAVNITLVAQHLTLLDHTERSTKLEAIVMPIKAKMDMAQGALACIGLLGVVAGIVDVIFRFLRH